MTVKVRLIGPPEQIAAILDLLGATMDVSRPDRTYPARGGFAGDVRAYAEVRPAVPQPVQATAARTDRPAIDSGRGVIQP